VGCSLLGFPADGRGRLAALRPAQDRYDLLRGVSFSFSFGHLVPFMGAQSLISNGSVRVSQVNRFVDLKH